MTELTFTKDTDGFYTSAFRANGRCHVQINKDVSDDAGVTVFEAAVDGEDYVVFQPTYDSSGILAEIDLPSGFNVRIKSTTQVQYASVIGDAEYIPFIDQTWLYFTMPEGGTVTLTKNGTPTEVTLEYSLDNGNTWTEWVETENVRSLTLAASQTMHVRNTSETSTGFSTYIDDYYNFSFSSNTYAGGDLRSLLCKTPANASNAGSNFCFFALFMNATNLIKANIKLLFTDLPRSFYRSMFEGCSNLIEVPETITATTASSIQPCYRMFFECFNITKLPRLTVLQLTNYAYGSLADGCSNLNYVYTEMTDISTNQNTIYSWLNRTFRTGDFYCHADLTIPAGGSGIPYGWTRHDI